MGDNNSPDRQHGYGLDVEDETEEPRMYRVLMHNDDYTPMDFVIFVLKKFFAKAEEEAHRIMLDVHNKGVGLAGVYSFEVAESKVAQVNQFAKNSQYPLKTSYEEQT
jgi:ATP-dependent Clp protease adaptor protein ClpS